MTTQTINNLANRSEEELQDIVSKAEAWISTPERRSEQQIDIARKTIEAIRAERIRRHQSTWDIQSRQDLAARASAAFAHRPIDRHERRLLSILLEGDWIDAADHSGSVVSDRLAFFGPPDQHERGARAHLALLVEERETDGRVQMRLRSGAVDAVKAAIRDHDLEIERRRRTNAR